MGEEVLQFNQDLYAEVMRLCLGTVQFGMDYVVQGGTRPAVEDAVRMLDYVRQIRRCRSGNLLAQ